MALRGSIHRLGASFPFFDQIIVYFSSFELIFIRLFIKNDLSTGQCINLR